jgi:hypothetical protein
VADQFEVDRAAFLEVSHFLDLLVNEGLAEKHGGNHSLTRDGRMRCDAIATEIPDPMEVVL